MEFFYSTAFIIISGIFFCNAGSHVHLDDSPAWYLTELALFHSLDHRSW